MKLTRVRIGIGVVALAVVAVAAPLAVLAGPDEPGVSDETRRVLPPELGGLTVIEAVGGVTSHGPLTLELRGGKVTLPKAKDILTGWSYEPPMEGLLVTLPGGTTLFFDNVTTEVEANNKSASDAALIKQILGASPDFKARRNRITGELP